MFARHDYYRFSRTSVEINIVNQERKSPLVNVTSQHWSAYSNPAVEADGAGGNGRTSYASADNTKSKRNMRLTTDRSGF